jgi:hypothetical protein
MNNIVSIFEVRSARRAAGEETASLLAGAAFTLGLLLAMANVGDLGATQPALEIEDLRIVSMPLEPPPPPPMLEEVRPVPEEMVPFTGIEIGASDSPVSIAVMPQDLEMFFPPTTQFGARIQAGVLHTEFRPKVEADFDANYVYQDTDVDQRPRAVVRTVPPIPPDVANSAPALRVVLLLLIGVNGKAESARVLESSGNAKFDSIVANTVQREWLFSPAIRRGKKVRVLAQQAFRVTYGGGGSPFDL